MNTFKRRLLLTICMVAFGVCLAVAQTNTIKHTVDRGETLASIAKHYATTEAKIIELNPDAAQFVYVGMELIIPDATSKSSVSPSTKATSETAEIVTNQTSHGIESTFTQSTDDAFAPYFGLQAGVSFNNYVGDDADGTNMKAGFHIGVFGGYRFYDYFTAEVGLNIAQKGYKMSSFKTSGNNWHDDEANYDINSDTHMNTLNLDIPILIGVEYAAFFAKVGPYLTYAMSGSMKVKGSNTYYPDIHSSETERYEHKTKLGDMKDFKRFGVGINASIGYRFDPIFISASYQRGLSKLYKKTDKYEQNILITIGYQF